MPIPFHVYDLKKAQQLIASRTNANAATNLAYLNGNHWQNANGWGGPMPKPTSAGGVTTLDEIERAFVSRNAIREIVQRHIGGVLAKQIHWKFTPAAGLEMIEEEDPETGMTVKKEESPEEGDQLLIDEAEAALVEWWDKREVREILQGLAASMLTTERGPLRLYIPSGLRDQAGNIPSGDLGESLGRIWAQCLAVNEDTLALEVASATVYTDKLTRQDVGIFTYKDIDPVTGEPKDDRAELTYLDEAGNTLIRIIGHEGDIEPPWVAPLAGHLTMYEATRPALVTPQIVSQQKLLNLAMTMKQHNVVLGGFLERVLLNAQLPGNIVRGTDGVERFIPDPLYVGAGATNAFRGITYVDAEGNEQITTPTMLRFDPVPVDTFSATEDAAYLAILQEAQQLHYALAGDSVVSGESRKQARDAFEKDLKVTAGKVEAAARWLLETALAMAAVFAGTPGRFDGLRAMVQARVDSGPISAEEMSTTQTMAGGVELLSQETAMSRIGIEDVDAEKDRMEQEAVKRQNSPEKKLEREQMQLALEASRAAMQGDGMAQAQQVQEEGEE